MDILSTIRWLFTGTQYGYTAYVLTPESRDEILKAFPPKYPEIQAHHITTEFGVPETSREPLRADLAVWGYADSGDGIEALLVAVDRQIRRSDGGFYHITLSLDLEAGYEPKDANKLVLEKYLRGGWEVSSPIIIHSNPTFIRFRK